MADVSFDDLIPASGAVPAVPAVPAGRTSGGEGAVPNGLSFDDLIPQQSGAPTFDDLIPQTSTTGDVAKSFAAGLGRGAADLAGLPGTIGDLAQSGLGWLGRKGYGLITGEAPDPYSESGLERFFAGPTPEVQAALPFGGASPVSGDVLRGGLSAATAGASDYQPQTTAGEYARTAGEFLPAGTAFGGGGLLGAARFGLAPAVASETAGQATEDTAFEPYARVAGALVGGAAGSKIGRPKTAPSKSAAAIRAGAGYEELKEPMKAARVEPSTYQKISRDLADDIEDFGPSIDLEDRFGGLLNRYQEQAQTKGGASLYDLERLRRSIWNTPTATDKAGHALAGRLIDKLDEAVESLPEAAVKTSGGEGKPVLDALKDAREAYRVGKKAQTIEKAVQDAQTQASGVENGLRIQFRQIAKNDKLMGGFTKTEQDAIKQVANGNFTRNAMRWLGTFGVPLDQGRNFLGSVIGATAGTTIGGPIGGLALPAIGTAAKAGAARLAQSDAQIAEALVKAGPKGAKAIEDAIAASLAGARQGKLRAGIQSETAVQVPSQREYAQ